MKLNSIAIKTILIVLFNSSCVGPPIEGDYNEDNIEDIAFHSPGSSWNTVPIVFSDGLGAWNYSNNNTPSWANEAGVIGVRGDFNGDNITDLTFYQPRGSWDKVPVLLGDGTGVWNSITNNVPLWANEIGVIVIPGNFNGDDLTDIAFYNPGSEWEMVPILLADGEGGWNPVTNSVPPWVNEIGIIGIPGDFNNDNITDIAFHQPGNIWDKVPILFGNGNGEWNSVTNSVPLWANNITSRAIPGYFNEDDLEDIAFHIPNGNFNSLPILFSDGNGGWTSTDEPVPGWVNQKGTIAIPGMFNSDDLFYDIAFYRPGQNQNTVSVLLSNGTGGWSPVENSVPSWANEAGTVALAGYFDEGLITDIAFHLPGSNRNTFPVLLSDGNGGWQPNNSSGFNLVNQLGTVAIHEYSTQNNLQSGIRIGVDPYYDKTNNQRRILKINFKTRTDPLVLQPSRGTTRDEKNALFDAIGLTGWYDGVVWRAGISEHDYNIYLSLEDNGGQVHGKLYILEEIVWDGGFICGDITIPKMTLPVYLSSIGPQYPAFNPLNPNPAIRSWFDAFGLTRREIDLGGILPSGQIEIRITMRLTNSQAFTPDRHYSIINGTIAIDAPNPCNDRQLSFTTFRKDALILKVFGHELY